MENTKAFILKLVERDLCKSLKNVLGVECAVWKSLELYAHCPSGIDFLFDGGMDGLDLASEAIKPRLRHFSSP